MSFKLSFFYAEVDFKIFLSLIIQVPIKHFHLEKMHSHKAA